MTGRCPSCGAELAGRYCAVCGERRPAPDDLQFRRYLGEAIHILVDADSRLVRSFRALLARPGLLTAEYVRGRRKPYLLPLQLFLIANIAYFVVVPLQGMDTFTTPLRTHMTGVPYRALATDLVHRTIEARELELAQYEARFDATIRGQARTLVILLVPLLAPFLVLAFPRRRPPLAHHLVFSTHFFAFVLLLLVAWAAALRLVFEVGIRMPAGFHGPLQRFLGDDIQSLLLAGALVLYAVPAFRRGYDVGWWGAALRALLLPVALLVIVGLYRLILFFTTLYAA